MVKSSPGDDTSAATSRPDASPKLGEVHQVAFNNPPAQRKISNQKAERTQIKQYLP